MPFETHAHRDRVGACPQFIKAAPVSQQFRHVGIEELIVHTGQHYDDKMSDVFFRDLPLPTPHVNLGVGSDIAGRQIGKMLSDITNFLESSPPVDGLLVYGDTNSTLAGALAGADAQIPVAHVESGLRSYNRTMPEEINRVLTDHCAEIRFCPTEGARRNLGLEGITENVVVCGDTMYDAVVQFRQMAEAQSSILEQLGLEAGTYVTATIHRNYNTDDPRRLTEIIRGLIDSQVDVVFPIHPRTRKSLQAVPQLMDLNERSRVRLIEPLSYLDMMQLVLHSRAIVTDSGGLQKEAYFAEVPCLTVRTETEWLETLENGWNRLIPADAATLSEAIRSCKRPPEKPSNQFGTGHAAESIVQELQVRLRTSA